MNEETGIFSLDAEQLSTTLASGRQADASTLQDRCSWSPEYLADAAVAALIDEVTLTPKPGLVDLRGSGAHADLNWSLMCRSAFVLHPTFLAMARAGSTESDLAILREQIGLIGRDGEAAMMRATNGVNTHRGAIWALGLLVTAAARIGKKSPQPGSKLAERIASTAGILARQGDRYAPEQTGNKGEQACVKYGVGGARGQAQAGFPHIVDIALPALRHSRSLGAGENAVRINALLAIIADLDDTCVLARAGEAALEWAKEGALRVLRAGGADDPIGKAELHSLDREFLALNISPGGAADLLAATLFLDRIAPE